MQKLKKIMFAFLISVMCLNNVSAVNRCSTNAKSELNKYVSQIKASYATKEEKVLSDNIDNPIEDGKQYEILVEYLEITLTNLTDQFYIEVSNDFNEEVKTYRYSDSDNGIITIRWDMLSEVAKFTFKIYANENTKCSGVLQKTLTLQLPRLNDNYSNPICEGISEFNLCQKYVTFAPMEYEDFVSRVNDDKEKNKIEDKTNTNQDKNAWENIKDFVSKNKYYFIGGGIAIVAIATGVTITIVVKKRRRIEL